MGFNIKQEQAFPYVYHGKCKKHTKTWTMSQMGLGLGFGGGAGVKNGPIQIWEFSNPRGI